MAEDLQYVFWIPMGVRPWTEAMDALFTHLAMTHTAGTPAETSGDESKKRLVLVTYEDSIRSLQSSLLMIAAQLRAYWLKVGGTLLSREFGEWVRKTCWEPGFSKPWRELLKNATGEDLNPQHFFDELEKMKKLAVAA